MYNIVIMKKIIALLSVLSLALLASCGATEVVEEENTNSGNVEMEETTTEENTEVVEEMNNEEESTDVEADVEANAETEEVIEVVR